MITWKILSWYQTMRWYNIHRWRLWRSIYIQGEYIRALFLMIIVILFHAWRHNLTSFFVVFSFSLSVICFFFQVHDIGQAPRKWRSHTFFRRQEKRCVELKSRKVLWYQSISISFPGHVPFFILYIAWFFLILQYIRRLFYTEHGSRAVTFSN